MPTVSSFGVTTIGSPMESTNGPPDWKVRVASFERWVRDSGDALFAHMLHLRRLEDQYDRQIWMLSAQLDERSVQSDDVRVEDLKREITDLIVARLAETTRAKEKYLAANPT